MDKQMEEINATFNEYQELAILTANMDKPQSMRMTNWALGLAGEAGETADLIKKAVFHGHELDIKELIAELGDILWYLAILSYEAEIPFENIALFNLAKLKERYPEGFDVEMSKNRKEYENNNDTNVETNVDLDGSTRSSEKV